MSLPFQLPTHLILRPFGRALFLEDARQRQGRVRVKPADVNAAVAKDMAKLPQQRPVRPVKKTVVPLRAVPPEGCPQAFVCLVAAAVGDGEECYAVVQDGGGGRFAS